MVRYAMFMVRDGWKVFLNDERTLYFPSEGSARLAAHGAAREAMARGENVELFVHSSDGELRRAEVIGAVR